MENLKLVQAKGLISELYDDGKLFILNQNTGIIYSLNKSAAYIYNLCQNTNINDIRVKYINLSDKYESKVLYENLLSDFNKCLSDLFHKGLINYTTEKDITDISYNKNISKQNITSTYNERKIASMNFKPKMVYLEITSKCNMHCTYCYNNSDITGIDMDKHLLFKLLSDMKQQQILSITISGGEPSLHPEFIPFLKACENADIHTTVVTNAWFSDNKTFVDALMNSNIQITLDRVNSLENDIEKGFGSYKATENLFQVLFENHHNNKRVMRVNIVKENMYTIDEFVLLAQKWHVTNIEFNFLNNLGRYKNSYNQIDINQTPELTEYILKKLLSIQRQQNGSNLKIDFTGCLPPNSCSFIFNRTGVIEFIPRITPNGDVYPCQKFTDSFFKVGNITYNSLDSIFSSKTFYNLITSLNERKGSSSCSNCIWKYICWKGCPAKAFMKYGTIHHDSGECRYWKYYYKEKYEKSLTKN